MYFKTRDGKLFEETGDCSKSRVRFLDRGHKLWGKFYHELDPKKTKVGYALTMKTNNKRNGILLPDGNYYLVLGKQYRYTIRYNKMRLIESRDMARSICINSLETIWKVVVDEKGQMYFIDKNP